MVTHQLGATTGGDEPHPYHTTFCAMHYFTSTVKDMAMMYIGHICPRLQSA
jgi:hypothetical protein